MLVYRALAAVGVGDELIGKSKVTGLFNILYDAAHQPQRIVRAGVFQPVDDLAFVRRGNNGGGAEGLLLFLRLKPARLKQMQPVALRCQRAQKLDQAAAAFFRIRVWHHHGVLCRVAVAKAGAAADFDERREAREHDVYLALVQIPEIQLRVHALVRRVHLQAGKLLIPEFRQTGKVLVHLFGGVFGPHGLTRRDAALAQQIDQPRLLAGLKLDRFHQAAAVVPALLIRAGAHARFHRQRVALGAVGADEAVAQTVKAVGAEICREELIAGFLIIQIVLDHAVFIAAAGGIQAHLEVAVVHIDVVETEFQIGKNGQLPRPSGIVAQRDIPDLHRVVHGHEQRLPGVDAAVVAPVFAVAQSMAAGIMLLGLSHRLPRNRPVIAGLIVPQIDIVARPVHGNTVGAKARDAVVFRRFIKQIPARRVVEHAVHIPKTDVIRPRDRHIHPVDHILAVGIVKVSIAHGHTPPSISLSCLQNTEKSPRRVGRFLRDIVCGCYFGAEKGAALHGRSCF